MYGKEFQDTFTPGQAYYLHLEPIRPSPDSLGIDTAIAFRIVDRLQYFQLANSPFRERPDG